MFDVCEIPGIGELRTAAAAGYAGIRVAIIDGPADFSHPCFRTGDISHAHPQRQGSAQRDEHGTHVASIIAAQPDCGLTGIAPRCSTRIYPVYEEGPDGALLPCAQADVARAINVALRDGADIINISSGQFSPTGTAERFLADAVRRCTEAGALIVAAAGNDGCKCLHVPAALDGVLAVGACDLDGRPLAFSNFGDGYLANGLLAPGRDVPGAAPGGGVVRRSGTSYAAPIISGVVALFLALMRQEGHSADPHAVRKALLATAAPCAAAPDAAQCLAGVLDIPAARKALMQSHKRVVAPRAPPPRPGGHRSATTAATANGIKQSGKESAMSNSAFPGQAHPGPTSDASAEGAGTAPSAAPAAATAEATAQQGQSAPAAAQAPVAPQAQAAVTPAADPSASMAGTAMPAPAAPGYMMVMPVAGMGQPAVMPGGVAPAAAATMPPQGAAPGAVAPAGADAGCACDQVRPAQADGVVEREKVFAIGRLFYDFGTEARQDYFVHAIAAWRDALGDRGDPAFGKERDRAGDIAAPFNPEIMVRFLLNLAPGETQSPALNENIPNANALIWTLTIDDVPVYALDPGGVYGAQIYITYVYALWYQEVSSEDPSNIKKMQTDAKSSAAGAAAQSPGDVRFTRISQAGEISGTTVLLNGTTVPTLSPAWRGTYAWDVLDILGDDGSGNVPEESRAAHGFLERIYNEFRNVGISPQDRALNYSAMNARQTKKVFTEMYQESMQLDTVEVDRSTICRPESDCWDVTFRFFNPKEVLTTARMVYQYTIDVSDIVPVPVGKLRKWQVA